jgi:hypothetical protein
LLAAGGPLGALLAGVGAFAALAIPELTKVQDALKKTGEAGKKAREQLTGPQRQLVDSVQGVKKAFLDIQKEVAPAIDRIVSLGATLVKDFLPTLGKLAQLGAKVIGAFVTPLDNWIKSKAFASLTSQFALFGAKASEIVGPGLVRILKALSQLFVQLLPTGLQVLRLLFPTLVNLIRAFTKLFVELGPAGVKILQALLPAIVTLVQDLAPAIVIIADLVAVTVQWLSKNHLLLVSIAAVTIAITAALLTIEGVSAPILLIVAAIAAVIVIVVEVRKHWKAIWAEIQDIAMTAWNFLTHGWGQFLFPQLFLIRKVVEFVRDHWRAAWNTIKHATEVLWHFIGPLFKIGFDIIVGLIQFFAWYFRKQFDLIVFIGKAAWKALTVFAQTMWNQVRPILQALGKVATFIFKEVIQPAAKFVWDKVTGFVRTAMDMGKTLIRTFLNVVLTVFGAIIHGAANAFGFIPGLGGKLKDAAHQFDIFRNRVNDALGGINDRKVDVGVQFLSRIGAGPMASKPVATGGRILGPGGPTDDMAGLFRLSNEEWVIRASSSTMYGYDAMNAVNEGRAVIYYSSGGPVGMAGGGRAAGVQIHTVIPSLAQINASINPIIREMAKTFITSIGMGLPAGHGAIGGGVQRWAPLVLSVLAMLGQPAGDLGTVLSQMTTESGGNPFAINLWDSNAAAGDPSRGLMQVIGSTFAAYAGPFRGRGIFDPLANIFAAINYAIHRYGSGWTSVLGHGHGYDDGGWLMPGLNFNMLRAPEPVLTPGQWDAIYKAASKGGDGATAQYHAHFDGLTGQTIESHVRFAFKLMDMQQGTLQRSGRRS